MYLVQTHVKNARVSQLFGFLIIVCCIMYRAMRSEGLQKVLLGSLSPIHLLLVLALRSTLITVFDGTTMMHVGTAGRCMKE